MTLRARSRSARAGCPLVASGRVQRAPLADSARRSTASPSIPPTEARPTPAEARATAARARAAGQPVIELGALEDLERSWRLDAVLRAQPTATEYARLCELLLARAVAFRGARPPGAREPRPRGGGAPRSRARPPARSCARGGRRGGGRQLEGDRRPRRCARGVRAGGEPGRRPSRRGGGLTRGVAGAVARAGRRRRRRPLCRRTSRAGCWAGRRSRRVSCRSRRRSLPSSTTSRAPSAGPTCCSTRIRARPTCSTLVALIFGRAGRFGGTERMLMELTFHTPDRTAGLARGAAVWERLGRPREACAQWIRAARWRDEAEDPLWLQAPSPARATIPAPETGRRSAPTSWRAPTGAAGGAGRSARRRPAGEPQRRRRRGVTGERRDCAGCSSKATSFARSASKRACARGRVGQVVLLGRDRPRGRRAPSAGR